MFEKPNYGLLQMNDSELIRELRKDNELALKALFFKLSKSLRYFAYRYVKSEEVAEEIVEDAFLKVWQQRGRFELISKLQAFMYVVIKNACLNYLERPKQKYTFQNIDDLEEELFLDEDLLQRVINAEFIKTLFEEIESLPSRQREVFRLSFIEGMSNDEISTHLQMSSNAVYANKSRAITQLRNRLDMDESAFLIALTVFFVA